MNDIDDKAYELKEDSSESRCPLCNSIGLFSFKGRDLLYNKPETYRYVRCSCCAAVYQEPMPTFDEIVRYYPDDYYVYAAIPPLKHYSNTKLGVLRYKYSYDLDVLRLLKLLSPAISSFHRDTIRFVPNGRDIDIGRGNGKLIRDMLAKRFGLRQIAVQTFSKPRIILKILNYLTGNREKPYNKLKFQAPRTAVRPISLYNPSWR